MDRLLKITIFFISTSFNFPRARYTSNDVIVREELKALVTSNGQVFSDLIS